MGFKIKQRSWSLMQQVADMKNMNEHLYVLKSGWIAGVMLRFGKDLWGSSSPIPLPKQGHLQQAQQDPVQAGLEYLQRRRIHKLPGQPVPGLRHPQSEEVLPHLQMELPLLQFMPVAPCPVAGHN